MKVNCGHDLEPAQHAAARARGARDRRGVDRSRADRGRALPRVRRGRAALRARLSRRGGRRAGHAMRCARDRSRCCRAASSPRGGGEGQLSRGPHGRARRLPEDVDEVRRLHEGERRSRSAPARRSMSTPLADLEEITGDLVDRADRRASIRSRSTGCSRRRDDPGREQRLPARVVPAAARAGGRIEVENNAVLTTISVPRLATVEGAIVITDNNALELISARRCSRRSGRARDRGPPAS